MKKSCYFCERTCKLDRHHIDMNRRNNHPKNLLDICRKCHLRLHEKIYNRLFIPGLKNLYKLKELELYRFFKFFANKNRVSKFLK